MNDFKKIKIAVFERCEIHTSSRWDVRNYSVEDYCEVAVDDPQALKVISPIQLWMIHKVLTYRDHSWETWCEENVEEYKNKKGFSILETNKLVRFLGNNFIACSCKEEAEQLTKIDYFDLPSNGLREIGSRFALEFDQWLKNALDAKNIFSNNLIDVPALEDIHENYLKDVRNNMMKYYYPDHPIAILCINYSKLAQVLIQMQREIIEKFEKISTENNTRCGSVLPFCSRPCSRLFVDKYRGPQYSMRGVAMNKLYNSIFTPEDQFCVIKQIYPLDLARILQDPELEETLRARGLCTTSL